MSGAVGVAELSERFANGELDPVQVTQDCLTRIAEVDVAVNAFVWVDEPGALEQASQLRLELAAGKRRGPLHGVPIAIKELIDVAGAPREYGSLLPAGEVAARDAEVVVRLRRAGAIIIGTTRSHEFGWGITTQHSERGSTRNPRDLDRVPGGSSGGAGAAVAAGMVPACIATDTGGSIRIPSAFCGVPGIKPTFGTVDRTGVVPLAPSFDTIGVIARAIADLPLVLNAISDRPDGMSAIRPRDLSNFAGLRIGVAPALLGDLPSTARTKRYEEAVLLAAALGAEIVELETPKADLLRQVFAVVQGAEAVDTHRRELGYYPSRAAEYSAGVRERLDRSSGIDLSDYLAAKAECRALADALVAALRTVDVLMTPVSPVAPPTTARPDIASFGEVEMELRAAVMGFTVPQNVAGLPSVTFPAGNAPDGLPVGLQLSAVPGADGDCLSVAALLSRELDGTSRG